MSNITQHVSVDTRFGNIQMTSDGNLTSGQLLDAMKDKLSDVGVASVLEAVTNYDELKKEHEDLKLKFDEDFTDEDDEDEEEPVYHEEIDCGIGKIEYVEPDNILLQQIMDRFAELFETKDALEISKLLNAL